MGECVEKEKPWSSKEKEESEVNFQTRGRQRIEGWRRRKRNWPKRSKELVIRRGRGCSGSTAVNWARMRRRMDPKTSMRRRESSKQSNPKRGYKRAERGRRRR